MADQLMPLANERVRSGLLLGEISRANKIRSDSKKVREAIETLAGTYQQPKEVIQLYYGNPQMTAQVESTLYWKNK